MISVLRLCFCDVPRALFVQLVKLRRVAHRMYQFNVSFADPDILRRVFFFRLFLASVAVLCSLHLVLLNQTCSWDQFQENEKKGEREQSHVSHSITKL